MGDYELTIVDDRLVNAPAQRRALGDLASYIRRWPEEAQALQLILDNLTANPDAMFDRKADLHITSSMLVVDRDLERGLIARHSEFGILVPGGHVDGGGTLQSAIREVEEEVAVTQITALLARPIHVDLHRIPARPFKNEGEHQHLDFMHLGVTERPMAIPDRISIIETRWETLDELAKLNNRIGIAARRTLKIVRD
ncbi:MAG: hypothetical protein CL472_00855 [Acidobacteria bacterium]|nr:hypothetical protein [Acidobacteriota bacterium]